ncbi:dethiobiotin synthase [Robiginitalea sp. SC105]|uniref:dethiobiotin synthase n=1 Tax=Robiginitalea sp. SC105 TaxID=2762332 RepID=UPI0016395243|nr:dethiobiotin synthase [Robiginitalea sp. SC105]MBC2837973.1 dethiobiotin synthase [Robiginitalea sp. SC105]
MRDDNEGPFVNRLFVTGISTGVGKTLAAAILVEALQADYWKPIQAGDLDASDSHTVRDLISNAKTVIHPNAYALRTPMSPHAAAEIDNIRIDLKEIKTPDTRNTLVIEGAGGLLVPLNGQDTICDLIEPGYRVIVVSRHYLGSINHTLMTLECLERRGLEPFLIFSGDPHPSTESIILQKTGVQVLGRIEELQEVSPAQVRRVATSFMPALRSYNLL